ncbi:MAG TPA: chalcone isomerase family protein [Candidatus Eisenbacteria bacterium]
MAGVAMPDSVRVERGLLRLNGMALYRRVGFPVLVAGLYLAGRESRPARILGSDSPRRYVTRFLRRVSAKRVCDAWRKGLANNTPGASVEVRAQFRTLCHRIRDFRAGDEITVTYLPASGSWVEIDGKQVGVIPGKAFADAYFALVLGPKPSLGDKFKRRLLGE